MVWTRNSATQHSAFQRCQRYWHFGWITKLERIKSAAMQRGTDIHAEVEHYLKTGEIRDSCYTDLELNYRPYVEALIPHLPPPMHDELIIEHRIDVDCGKKMPGWVGYIDIGYSGSAPLQIRDIKSTSDFRYAKTEVEILEDIQPISYAKWAYEVAGHKGPIDLGLIYVKTEKKVVRKKPKTKLVSVIVDQAHVEDVWAREMDRVREMQKAALVKSAHDLPPTITACGMYGGCDFRKECGLEDAASSLKGLFQLDTKKKGSKDMSFMDEVKKRTAARKAAENKKQPDDNQVLSDDAPSRETEVKAKDETIETAPVEKKPKAKKKTTKKKANGANGDKSFTLYIDCMPSKDLHNEGVDPTLFEDWFSPLVMKMNEAVAQEEKLASYLLLPYAQEKAMVAATVGESIGSLPEAMIVMRGIPGANDALAGLIPHATKVVRSIR